MFDRGQSRIIIILGLLGFFACFFSLPLLSGYSAVDFEFPLEKEEIIEAADRFIYSQGSLPLPLVKKANVSSDREAIIFIQRKLGPEKASELWGSIPLYYWQVDYLFPQTNRFSYISNRKILILNSFLDLQRRWIFNTSETESTILYSGHIPSNRTKSWLKF